MISFAQTELSAVQLVGGAASFLSNTQAKLSENGNDCSIDLALAPTKESKEDDTKWQTISAYRIGNSAYLSQRSEHSYQSTVTTLLLYLYIYSSILADFIKHIISNECGCWNQRARSLGQCSEQVITDVTSVFVGGVPAANFVVHNETSSSSGSNGIGLQRRNFIGCMRSLSTLMQLELATWNLSAATSTSTSTTSSSSSPDETSANSRHSGSSSSIRLVHFEPSEASNVASLSNAVHGCPLPPSSSSSLSTNDTTTFHLLGFGYLAVDMKRTFPLALQSSDYLLFEAQVRTEWSAGLLLLNYDYYSDQFVMLRLAAHNALHIAIHFGLLYKSNSSSAATRTLDLWFNETVQIAPQAQPQLKAAMSSWTRLRFEMNVSSLSVSLRLNETETRFDLLSNKSAISSSGTLLPGSFYLDVASFVFGGVAMQRVEQLTALVDKGSSSLLHSRTTRFRWLVHTLTALGHARYFSGCMRDLSINRFRVDLHNVSNVVSGEHVRLDGCPATTTTTTTTRDTPQSGRVQSTFVGGGQKRALDTGFTAFTEYFYRVIAVNAFGDESASDWQLVRTPDARPGDTVDTTLLEASALTGYKLHVRNMSNYCVYCNTATRLNKSNAHQQQPFNGIIRRFTLAVKKIDGDEQSTVIHHSSLFY